MSYKFNPKGSTAICDYAVLWKKQNKPLELLPSQEPNPHIVIVGMSGFGKSMGNR